MLKYTSQSGSTLFAQLPIELANDLRTPIQNAIALGNSTAQELQKEISQQGNSSKAFIVLQEFLANLFGTYAQTTIVNDTIYIGNGLQLSNNPTTKALFLTLDPDRDWDFNNLFSKPGYPVPALTSDEISKLTWLSMIGVDDPQYGNFTGYLPSLIENLGALSQNEFSINQLLGLLTTTYSTNLPLPSTIQDALNFQLDYEPLKEIAPMMCIVEYANPAYDPFLANLCLASGAMYLGEPEQKYLGVHTTFRAVGRVKEKNPDVQVEESVYWGIPIGDADFPGVNNITVIPSFNPNNQTEDNVVLGTPKDDQIEYDDSTINKGSSFVILGGEGNNNFSVTVSPYTFSITIYVPQFVYMSGSGASNFNTFYLTPAQSTGAISIPYNIYIKTNGDGVYHTNYPTGVFLPTVFGGPIVNNIIQFGGSSAIPQSYTVKTTSEDDGTDTLTLCSSDTGNISFSNFTPGKFRLLPGGTSKNLFGPTSESFNGAEISNNGFVLLSYSIFPPEQIFAIYDTQTGKNTNNVTMNGVVVSDIPPILFASTDNGVIHTIFLGSDDNEYNMAFYYANITSSNIKTITPHLIEYGSNIEFPIISPISLVSLDYNKTLFFYSVTKDFQTYTYKISINGEKPIVIKEGLLTNNQLSSYGVVVIDQGRFVINFCNLSFIKSKCLPSLYDSFGHLLGNFTFPTMEDPNLISWDATPLNDGFMVCSQITNGYNQISFLIYNEKTGWSKPIINSEFNTCGTLIQLQNGYSLFLELNTWLLDNNYKILAGPLNISYGIDSIGNQYAPTSWYITPNDDVMIVAATVFAPSQVSVVNLTTSYLPSLTNSFKFLPENPELNSLRKIVISYKENSNAKPITESKSVNDSIAKETKDINSQKTELPTSETNTQTFNVPVQKSEASELTADIFLSADRVSRWTSDAAQSVVGFFSRTISSATSKATDVLKSARDYVLPEHVEKELTGEQLEKLQLYIDDVARLRKSASYLALQGYEYYAAELDELSARAEKYLDAKRSSLAELKDLTYQSSYWTRQYVQPCESRIYHDPFHARWQQWNLAHPKFAINATEISVAKIQTTLFGASANSSTLNNTTLPMITAGAAVRYLGR